MKTHLLAIATLLLAPVAIRAAEAKPNAGASAAFARLKTLAGDWEAQTKDGKAHLSYELVSGGTAVMERETGDGRPVMLTVYYVDGDRLLLTHYCMAGNQPRMQAQQFHPETGELVFDFLDATNLPNAQAGHMHSAKLRLVDNDHLTSEWQFYDNGQPKFTETAQYTRVR